MSNLTYSVSWIDEKDDWKVHEEQFGEDSQAAWECKFKKQEEGFTNVRRWSHVKCHCGETTTLQGDTECNCGQLYNGAGQKLLPRHMWEEPWEEE